MRRVLSQRGTHRAEIAAPDVTGLPFPLYGMLLALRFKGYALLPDEVDILSGVASSSSVRYFIPSSSNLLKRLCLL